MVLIKTIVHVHLWIVPASTFTCTSEQFTLLVQCRRLLVKNGSQLIKLLSSDDDVRRTIIRPNHSQGNALLADCKIKFSCQFQCHN